MKKIKIPEMPANPKIPMAIKLPEKQEKKVLGKIEKAEFGKIHDLEYLFGLKLVFSLDGGSSGIATNYAINIHKDCKWSTNERNIAIISAWTHIYTVLEQAKVENVSDLRGIPVEVTINSNRTFVDFRILEEVL